MRIADLHFRFAAVLAAATLLSAACGPKPGPTVAATESSTPDATQASAVPGASVTPSPAPSGSAEGRIVFIRFDAGKGFYVLHTIRPDGSDIRQPMPDYPLGFGLVRWSADGGLLAAWSTKTDGFETIIPPDPLHHRHLYLSDPSLRLQCAAWSPDGQVLACEGWSTAERGHEGIYTVRVSDGGDLRRLTSTIDGIHDIPGDYSPDGTRIVFVRATRTPDSLGELWVCNADGSDPRKLTDALTGYRVSWSPDGRWIAGSDAGDLLIFDLQHLAAEPLRITIPGGLASVPRWSPDSKRIVFEYRPIKTTLSEVYVVNADGLNFTQLTSGPDDESPDWGAPGF
jgi:WD40 repeat protein